MEKYYEFTSNQCTDEWILQRIGRITATNFFNCVHYYGSKLDETLMEIVGLKEKTFSEISLRKMKLGLDGEPFTRKWFEKEYNYDVRCTGLCVPYWNQYIGASPDGICYRSGIETNKTIEIKRPEEMYFDLKNANFLREMGFADEDNSEYRINDRHYCQIQTQLAVLGKEECYYIVDSINNEEKYVQIIKFNQKYWDKIYKKIEEVINNKLIKLIKDNNINFIEIPRND